MNKRKPTAVYVRVSTEEQVKEGFSISAQLNELNKYAEQNQLEIVAQYIDEGASGKSIDGRAEMKRLLREAKEKKFEVVMVYKLDRLARKLKDSLEISEILEKFNVKLISLKEKFDTSTPQGMMTFQLFGMIAELERSNIVERGKLGQQQRAREGKFNGGIILGYDSVNKSLVINEKEAIIVRKIFDYAEEELGLKAITRRLNAQGYRTKKGKEFSTNSIKTILNNPIYIGKIRYNQLENWSEKRRSGKNPNYILSDGVHKPIITLEQWERVQGLLKKRSYMPARSHTPFLLSGLVKCPKCGHGMVPGRSKGAKGQTYRYYNCGQFHNKGASVCKAHSIRADLVEQQVFEEIARIVKEPYVLQKLVEKINEERKNLQTPIFEEQRTIESHISKLNNRQRTLKEKIMDDPDLADLFKPDLLNQQKEIEKLHNRLQILENNLSEADTKPINTAALQRLISNFFSLHSNADPDKQKSLYRMLIKDIQITKDGPRGIGRQVRQINLHFDFTTDTLFHPSIELLHTVYDYVEPLDNGYLEAMNSDSPKLGDLMKSLSILPLTMIRFSFLYSKSLASNISIR